MLMLSALQHISEPADDFSKFIRHRPIPLFKEGEYAPLVTYPISELFDITR